MTTLVQTWVNHPRPCPCDGDDPHCPACTVETPARIFTGEGPNLCRCGQDVGGTSHWPDEFGQPSTTCAGCGLHYTVEGDEVAIYGDPGDGFGLEYVGVA